MSDYVPLLAISIFCLICLSFQYLQNRQKDLLIRDLMNRIQSTNPIDPRTYQILSETSGNQATTSSSFDPFIQTQSMNDEAEARRLFEKHGLQDGLFDDQTEDEELMKDLY